MTHDQARTRTRRAPSPIFLGLVAVAAISGWALWNYIGLDGSQADGGIVLGLIAFVFVGSSWVVTLCLHEFGHAFVAFRNGDLSVEHRGYLTLDPRRYTHVVFSIVLPLLFVLLGGIGLPGGAVFIDRRALRTRFAHTAVSAAGPLMNLAIAIVLAIALAARQDLTVFWAAVAFLLFLQVTAAVLNLLPVPGLDGYGIIEPYLPREWTAQAAKIAPYATLGLFALLWIPPVNAAFFAGIDGIITLLGVPEGLWALGYQFFQFWR